MAKPKPRTTPASRQRTAQRAEARQVMRESAARTGTKARLASGVKPGTKVATAKLPPIKNTAKPTVRTPGYTKGGKLTMEKPAAIRSKAPSKPVGTGGGGVSKPAGAPKGPQLPKLPTTTKTIRATGAGGGTKIQRLASTAAPGSPAPRVNRSAARAANRLAKGYGKPGGAERGIRGSAQLLAIKEGLTARNTAPGTISSVEPGRARRIEAMQRSGKNYAAQEQKARAANAKRGASSFDDAFRSARKAGVKTFTWKGKQYTTKKKGE